jgi:hypothetical protein
VVPVPKVVLILTASKRLFPTQVQLRLGVLAEAHTGPIQRVLREGLQIWLQLHSIGLLCRGEQPGQVVAVLEEPVQMEFKYFQK